MRIFTLLSAMLVAGLLAAQTNHRVEVRSNVFDPADITIQAGDTITWENVDGFHNVNGTLATFPSNPEGFGNSTGTGWTYQFVFDQEGMYNYQCNPHQSLGMTGTVTVEAAAGGGIVISEIMYNPPEAGNDVLEFIELHNAGTTPVDISGWSMGETVELEFPTGTTIDGGEFLILCEDSAAFISTFSYSGATLQWTNGALSNGGEDVTLLDGDGNVVSLVDYDDSAPWPLEADGNGPSLQICDVTMDTNDPTNWAAAATPTGVEVDMIEYLMNPGSLPACEAPAPTLTIGNDFTVDEDAGTLNLRVIATNFTEAPMVVFSLDIGSTATNDVDFSVVNGLPQTVIGEAGDLDTLLLTINITDDMDEEIDETMVFNIATSQMGVNIPDSQIAITIDDNDATSMVTTIGAIDDIDADGVAIFDGQTVTVEGVVHAPNFRIGGIQTTIIDGSNDGIGIFSSDDPLGYTVTEGDLIRVTGEVDQFRGLLQIRLTEVVLVSQDNELFDPTFVTQLNEDSESQLVTIENLIPESTDNVPTSGDFNFNFLDGGDNVITIRIVEDVNIDLAGIIQDYVNNGGTSINITGIGGQFDNDSPFTDGYQLFPRRDGDIATVSSLREPAWAADLQVFPNPVNDRLEVRATVRLTEVRLFDLSGRELLRRSLDAEQTSIDVNALVPGTYHLRLLGPDGQVNRLILKN